MECAWVGDQEGKVKQRDKKRHRQRGIKIQKHTQEEWNKKRKNEQWDEEKLWQGTSEWSADNVTSTFVRLRWGGKEVRVFLLLNLRWCSCHCCCCWLSCCPASCLLLLVLARVSKSRVSKSRPLSLPVLPGYRVLLVVLFLLLLFSLLSVDALVSNYSRCCHIQVSSATSSCLACCFPSIECCCSWFCSFFLLFSLLLSMLSCLITLVGSLSVLLTILFTVLSSSWFCSCCFRFRCWSRCSRV